MTPVAAYLLLFVAVGIGFIFVHLVAGKLIRPHKPAPSKGTIYECGEPTIGSAWIQFDVRFYVVALLFVIFDVEVAFFFPWAVVFGKANTVAALGQPANAEDYQVLADKARELVPPAAYADHASQMEQLRNVTQKDFERHQELKRKLNELRKAKADPKALLPKNEMKEFNEGDRVEAEALRTLQQARKLGWLAFGEILVFFGVLLVGFAYLWRRGDIAWVRSMTFVQSADEPAPPRPPLTPRQPAPEPLAAVHS